jgi:WD40 repeat protein
VNVGPISRVVLVASALVLTLPASAARLPVLASHNYWPVFSPDSKRVAYTTVNGQSRIFTLKVVAAAAGRPTVLAQAGSQLMPSWSPDSKSVAYQSGGRIWTVAADGRNRRHVGIGLYPAWSSKGTLAYVVGGVVRAGTARYGSQVIGTPAWSPNGEQIAYPQSDGIYVDANRIATPPGEVRTVAWSPDGKSLAYVSGGNVYVVGADGTKPVKVAGPFRSVSPLDWSNASDELAYTADGKLAITDGNGGWHTQRAVAAGIGASYAPAAPHSDILAYSGPLPQCPGHDGIRLYQARTLAGSCAITGTALADRIQGTNGAGDLVAAGAGNDTIRVQDRHTDRVDCGPGRDTVWADRIDRLSRCEIIHR